MARVPIRRPGATRQGYTNNLLFIAIFGACVLVSAAIARLIAFEVVVLVEMIGRLGFLAAFRQFAFIAVVQDGNGCLHDRGSLQSHGTRARRRRTLRR